MIEANVYQHRLEKGDRDEGSTHFSVVTLYYTSRNIRKHLLAVSYNNDILGSTMFNIFIIFKIIIWEWGADNEAEWC